MTSLTDPLSSLEENLGLIAVNIPVMVPLYKLLREKFPSSYGHIRLYLRKPSNSDASASQYPSRTRTFQRMEDMNQSEALMKPLPQIRMTVDTMVDIV